jgi:hypothetical protein
MSAKKALMWYGTAAVIGVMFAMYSHRTPPIQNFELRQVITQLLIHCPLLGPIGW